MRDFIERLRAKPEHVRRRIAFGTTVGITGAVTLVWFFTLLFAGTLSLAIPSTVVNGDGTLAQADGSTNVDVNTDGSTSGGNASNVAGVNASGAFVSSNSAAAPQQSNFSKLLAAIGISTAKPSAPALKVEDAAPTSTPAQRAAQDPTTIPF